MQLPEAASFSSSMSEQSLVLVDKTEYEASDSLVLWIPTDISGAGEFGGVGLKVTREVDNSTLAETVLDTNISVMAREGPGVMKMDLTDLTLTSGRYQVMMILSSDRS